MAFGGFSKIMARSAGSKLPVGSLRAEPSEVSLLGTALEERFASGAAIRVLGVIPTLNEAAHIESVLLNLLSDRTPWLSLTLVVSDGGSSDGTQELVSSLAARHASLKLIHNPARIQSSGVNLAVRRFGGEADVLIRCDAHAYYQPAYFSRLVQTMLRAHAQAVVVPMDSRGSTPIERALSWVSDSKIGSGGSAHRAGRKSGFVDHGHHAAFRLDTFRAAGGYDESFTHNEDAELDCRQRALGARIYLDSEIRVGYCPRSSLAALFWQYFRYGAGRSRTVRRHPHSLRLRQLAVPLHLLISLLGFALAPWTQALLLWPAFYLSVLLLVSVQLSLQNSSFCGLLALPIAFTMHTAWAAGFFAGLVQCRERAWSRDMAVPLWLQSGSEDCA